MMGEAAAKKPGLKRAATMIDKYNESSPIEMPANKRTKSNPVNASASTSAVKTEDMPLVLQPNDDRIKALFARAQAHRQSQYKEWAKPVTKASEFRFPPLPGSLPRINSMESVSTKASSSRRPPSSAFQKQSRVTSSRSSSTSGGPSSRYTLSSASFPSSSSQGPEDDCESEDDEYVEGDNDDHEIPPSSSSYVDDDDVFSGPSSPIKIQSQYRIPPVPPLIPNEEGDSSSSPCLLGSDDEDDMKLSYPGEEEPEQVPSDEEIDQLTDEADEAVDADTTGDASGPECTTDGVITETEEGGDSDANDGNNDSSEMVLSSRDEDESNEMDAETESRLFDELFQSDALGAGFSPKSSPKRHVSNCSYCL